MMIGLKRDLRRDDESLIYPQEVGYVIPTWCFYMCAVADQAQSYRIAQELRCDRYAECSAVTGELLAETFEDVVRLAGMTTTEKGGQTEGGCIVM